MFGIDDLKFRDGCCDRRPVCTARVIPIASARSPLVIPTVMTLKMLADVRTIVRHLPTPTREKATRRYVVSQLAEVARRSLPSPSAPRYRTAHSKSIPFIRSNTLGAKEKPILDRLASSDALSFFGIPFAALASVLPEAAEQVANKKSKEMVKAING